MANIRMYITEPSIPVRAMRTDHFDIRNWASFVFASNKPDPIQIPISDRRFHVAKYQPNKLEITDAELDAIEGELMDFTCYLMHYQVDVAKARTPSKNSQREKIQYLTRTSIDETTEAFREGNIDYFLEHFNVDTVDLDVGPSIADAVYRRFIREAFFHAIEKKQQRISRDTLQQLCEYLIGRVPNTPAKFSKFIRHHGIELIRLRPEEGSPPTYGISVKWKLAKRTRTDWESFFTKEGSPSRLRVVK